MAAVVERVSVDEGDPRLEDRLTPVEPVRGGVRGIAARDLARLQALHVLAVVASFSRLARDRLGAELAAARVGVERRTRDAECVGGLPGREKVGGHV